MEDIVNAVIDICTQNRSRYPKHWAKVRADRIEKIVPAGTPMDSFMEAFMADDRVHPCLKEAGAQLVEAVKVYDPAVWEKHSH